MLYLIASYSISTAIKAPSNGPVEWQNRVFPVYETTFLKMTTRKSDGVIRPK